MSVDIFNPFSLAPIQQEVPQLQEPAANEKTGKCGHLSFFFFQHKCLYFKQKISTPYDYI